MSYRMLSTWAAAIAVTVAACGVAVAEEWGTLTGKFVVDGKAPELPPPTGTEKDNCNKHNIVDEKITVSDKNELVNAFVYLRTKKPKVAPTYAETEDAKIELDNKNCRFEPHALIYRKGQTLVLKNSDPFGHNSNIQPFKNAAVNPLLPSGEEVETKFDDAETLPTKVGCNIHPWIGAWVLIRDDPYAAVSGPDGTFTIKDLPAGKELEFQLWQEAAGNLKSVSFKGGKADTKGRFKLKIKPGKNDLGEIKVPASLLKK